MTSKSKILITLTNFTILDGVIHYSVTDGNATLQSMSGWLRNNSWSDKAITYLRNDFLSVVKELIQGNPTYQQGDVDFTQSNWPELSIRFAIHPDLVTNMVMRYRENSNNAPITKLDEWVINLFDKVNGNTAVSNSVGIAQLVKGIQTGEIDLGDKEPEMDWSDKVADFIFSCKPWDPEQQGLCFITEELDDGVEIDLNVVRAVGNVFITGTIGKVHIRLFKAQAVSVYTSWDDQFNDRPQNFQLYHRSDFISFIKGLTEVVP